MRKLGIMMITVVSMCLAFTGCEKLRRDNVHASVTLTTSNGDEYVWKSVNGAGVTKSGKDMALHHKSEFILRNGETAKVTFKCYSCGNAQEYNISEAWAKVLSCDCPEEINEGNSKEYTAIRISFIK